MTLEESACAVAWLWNWSNVEGGVLSSAAVITVEPTESFRLYHHRMPLLLRVDQLDDYATGIEELLRIVSPRLPDRLRITPVGNYVSKPGNKGNKDIQKCTAPVGPVITLEAEG